MAVNIEEYVESTNSLTGYLESLTKKCLKAKLVQCHSNRLQYGKFVQWESWSGDWWHRGQPHFLARLERHKDGFRVYCTGTDDIAFGINGLKLAKAEILYANIVDGISIRELEKLGLTFDG